MKAKKKKESAFIYKYDPSKNEEVVYHKRTNRKIGRQMLLFDMRKLK
jgi:hypothetical protein